MSIFKEYFIFVVIGFMPTMISDYNCVNWQWWAYCMPYWVGIFMYADEILVKYKK